MNPSWKYRVGAQKPPVVCHSPKPPIVQDPTTILLTLVSKVVDAVITGFTDWTVELQTTYVPAGPPPIIVVTAPTDILPPRFIVTPGGPLPTLFRIPNQYSVLDVRASWSGQPIAEEYLS